MVKLSHAKSLPPLEGWNMVIQAVKSQQVQMTTENGQLQWVASFNSICPYFIVPKYLGLSLIIYLSTVSQRFGCYKDKEHFIHFKSAFLS